MNVVKAALLESTAILLLGGWKEERASQ